MILFDTNVLSAIMRNEPDEGVVAWSNRFPRADIWTTTINVYEVRTGISQMAAGRRRDGLERAYERLFDKDLVGRIAGLDRVAAEQAALLNARRLTVGRTVDVRDTLIAGIAVSLGAQIATRNVRHFRDLPVVVVNPWD